MKTAIANASRTCPAWCVLHDPESDVCLGVDVTVNVTDAAGWQPWMAKALSVMLGADPDDGVSISLAINHTGPYEVPVAEARRFALAILAECERAGAPLVPGPRASTDPAQDFGGLGSTWSDPAVRRAVRETIAESEADR